MFSPLWTILPTIQLLETKNKVFGFIIDFVSEVEARKDLKVSVVIRCDNGGEYVSNQMKNWCKSKGIVLNYTIPLYSTT